MRRTALGAIDANTGTPGVASSAKRSADVEGSTRAKNATPGDVHASGSESLAGGDVARTLSTKLEAVAAGVAKASAAATAAAISSPAAVADTAHTLESTRGGKSSTPRSAKALRKSLAEKNKELKRLTDEGTKLFEAYQAKCDKLKEFAIRCEDLRVLATEKGAAVEAAAAEAAAAELARTEAEKKLAMLTQQSGARGGAAALAAAESFAPAEAGSNAAQQLFSLMEDINAVSEEQAGVQEQLSELHNVIGAVGGTAANEAALNALLQQEAELKAALKAKDEEIEAVAAVSRDTVEALEAKLAEAEARAAAAVVAAGSAASPAQRSHGMRSPASSFGQSPDGCGGGVSDRGISELRKSLAAAQRQNAELQEFGEVERQALADTNRDLQSRIESTTEQMQEMQALLLEAKGELDAANAARDTSEAAEGRISQLESDLKQVKAAAEAAAADAAEEKARADAAEEKLRASEKIIAELKVACDDATAIAEQEAAARAKAAQAKSESLDESDELRATIDKLTKDLEESQEQVADLRSELDAASGATTAAVSEKEEAQQEAASARAELLTKEAELKAATASADEATKAMEAAVARAETLESQLSASEAKATELGAVQERLKEAEHENADLSKKCEELASQLDEAHQAMVGAEQSSSLEEATTNLAAAREDVATLQAERDQLMAQLDELCDALDDEGSDGGAADGDSEARRAKVMELERSLAQARAAEQRATTAKLEAEQSERRHRQYLLLYKRRAEEKINALNGIVAEGEEEVEAFETLMVATREKLQAVVAEQEEGGADQRVLEALADLDLVSTRTP